MNRSVERSVSQLVGRSDDRRVARSARWSVSESIILSRMGCCMGLVRSSSVCANRSVERSVSHQLIGRTINLFVSQLSRTAVEIKLHEFMLNFLIFSTQFEFLFYEKLFEIFLATPKLQNEFRSN